MFVVQEDNQVAYNRQQASLEEEKKAAEEALNKNYKCRLEGTFNVAKVPHILMLRHQEL